MNDPKILLDGQEFDVPVDGSLGLLALGDIGLKAWRKKREEILAQMETARKNEGENKLKDAGASPINTDDNNG